jgi:predicted ABC-type ATPase
VRPYAFVIAGPNGSGKSTLIRQLQSSEEYSFPEKYINADDIERELPPDATSTKSEREKLAFQEARRRRKQFREEGIPHAFETVFSHTSNLLDLQRLRESGYSLRLYCVTTQDAALNVERVKRRVLVGGHGIPEDKVRARYARSLKFLPRAAEMAHVTYVYDNSDTLQLIGHVEEGTWRPILSEVPTYLREAFVEPIVARQTERRAMAAFGEEDGLDLPDEENGLYTGTVVAVGVHYVVQEVMVNGLATRYRHDALWFAEQPKQVWKGKTAQISYGQTEYGLATISFL